METLIIYLIGWILLSIGIFIFKVETDNSVSKKLHAWRSFWPGMWSWIGIIVWVTVFIVFLIVEINECIENKLR